MPKLTQKKLKENLHYDPETGVFTWIKSRAGTCSGDIANNISAQGYVRITIDYKAYRGNRLAWLYMYGYFPENDLDHKDRDRSNDRIKNLRETSKQCNARNTGNPNNNTSGVKGVVWNKNSLKWKAQVMVNQKMKYLGEYLYFGNAVCARLATEQCLNWSSCDAESPAFKWVKENIQPNLK